MPESTAPCGVILPRFALHWESDAVLREGSDRGPSLADMNEAVLHYIEEHALTPDAIEQVIQLSERDDIADQRTKLEREQKDLANRLEPHLVDQIANAVSNAFALSASNER